MKKIVFSLSIVFAFCLIACGDEKVGSDSKPVAAATPSVSDHPDYNIGLELIAKSDCWSCHKISETSIGPSYEAVAIKYEPTQANYELLAGKIINGGKGVWGATPMNAHPDISKETAIAMTKYILMLKPNK